VRGELARGTLRVVLARFAIRRVDRFAVDSERRHLRARTRVLLDVLRARVRTARR
jgi:hypothetical protein